MAKRSLCKRWLSENVLGVRGAWCNRFLVCEQVLRKCVEAANAKSRWRLFDSEQWACQFWSMYDIARNTCISRFVIRFARPCHVETLFVSLTPCICPMFFDIFSSTVLSGCVASFAMCLFPPTKWSEVLKCQQRNPKKVPRTNAELMDGRMGGWDVTLKALGTEHASFWYHFPFFLDSETHFRCVCGP